jgi:hypothetical protein
MVETDGLAKRGREQGCFQHESVVYVATYRGLDDAQAEQKAVKRVYFDGVIGVYDAAVISKEA